MLLGGSADDDEDALLSVTDEGTFVVCIAEPSTASAKKQILAVTRDVPEDKDDSSVVQEVQDLFKAATVGRR